MVTVNGEVAEIGMKADPTKDLIKVKGKKINLTEKQICILLYKPKGYVSTVKDPQGRPKVTDLVRIPGVRLFPVGRLDLDTSGLILLTNDGELAYLLTHPKHAIWKTYHALVKGIPDEDSLMRLKKGINLPEGKTAPARVKLLKTFQNKSLLEISLREGKKRQVRRMCLFIGHPVLDLKRVQIAFLGIGDLQPGQFRYLSPEETLRLKKLASMRIKEKD